MVNFIKSMRNAYPQINSVNTYEFRQIQKTKVPENNKQAKNTTSKIVVGAAAAALAAVGIYLVLRGKKPLNSALKKPVTETLDKFKSIGKFVKGKAITNDGKIYTGILTKEFKDGTKLVFEYKDGILQSSAKFKGNKKIFEKLFTYSEDNVLTNVARNGKTVWKKTISPDGSVFVHGTRGAYLKNISKDILKIDNWRKGADILSYCHQDVKKVFANFQGNARNRGVAYKRDGKTGSNKYVLQDFPKLLKS